MSNPTDRGVAFSHDSSWAIVSAGDSVSLHPAGVHDLLRIAADAACGT